MSEVSAPVALPSSTISAFRATLDALAAIALAEGAALRPYDDASLPIFARLPEAIRRKVADDAEAVRALWVEARGDDGSISNSKRLLWRFLSRMKLRPPSDLLDRIGEDWAVEIYNREGLQLFRSFSVFRLTSFSLEELLSVPWWERYARDEDDSAFLRKYVDACFEGEVRRTIALPAHPHFIEEVGSVERLRIHFEAQLMAPLFENDTPAAALVASIASCVAKGNDE